MELPTSSRVLAREINRSSEEIPDAGIGSRSSGRTLFSVFFQPFNQPPLLPHQPVNLRRLSVEKRRDLGLLGFRREYGDLVEADGVIKTEETKKTEKP